MTLSEWVGYDMLKSTRYVPTLLLTLLSSLAGVLVASARAQIGAEISPARVHVSAQPGETLTGTVALRNPTGTTMTFAVAPSDFALDPQDKIVPLPVNSLPASMASWLHVGSSSLDLAPGASTTLHYSISVPKGATPGTHWGMVLFRTGTGGATGQSKGVGMGTAVQIAFITYVDVGKLSYKGTIADISLVQGTAPDAPSSHATSDVRITFKNTGNAVMGLQGKLQIRTSQGKLVHVYQLPQMASLPSSVTVLDVALDPPLDAGSYLATALVNYGTSSVIAGQAEIHVP